MNNGDYLQPSSTGEQSGDARLLAAIRQELDQSCASLDGQTLSRLHRIRSAAIEQQYRHSAWRRLWLPVGGLATACALALTIGLQWHGGRGHGDGNLDAVENVEILAADENLDFYQNYEFYQWLSQN